MSINSAAAHRLQAGISLIEVVIFIVILGIGIAGLTSLMGSVVRDSANPMLQKQSVAIAESMLEEIMLQPYTICDPAAYHHDTGTCDHAEATGPIDGGLTQTRFDPGASFNNVNDYHGYNSTGIRSINDGTTVIAGLENYSVAVAVVEANGEFPAASVTAGNALRIDVTVTDPTGQTTILTGYRLRYAPIPNQ